MTARTTKVETGKMGAGQMEAGKMEAGQAPCILITGGGSGGHVFPGLAVAEELVRRGWKVAWVGRPSSLEKRLVRRHGLEFHALEAKPLLGRGLLGKMKALWTVLTGGLAGRKLVRQLKPQVVLGTGGYVSAPASLGARLCGVPTLLLEPNAEPGVANRALSRFAREALVADEKAGHRLGCPAHVTGVPVRSEFFDIAEALPFGSATRILVLGGSQGAAQLNRLLPAALARLADRGGLEDGGQILVRHQTGERHLQAAGESYAEHGIETVVRGLGFKPDGANIQVELSSFLNNVSGSMAEAHLILSRAGAITLAEVCAAGRPTLLVPLSIAGAHQVYNARRLEEAGAAEVFEPKSEPGDSASVEAEVERFATQLQNLLDNRRRLSEMAASARALGRPNAAADIADRVEHFAGERPTAPRLSAGLSVGLSMPAAAAAQVLGGQATLRESPQSPGRAV